MAFHRQFEMYKSLKKRFERVPLEIVLAERMKLISFQWAANSADRYFPNEAAFVRFSFRDGVDFDNNFLIDMKPFQIPSGCSAELMDRYQEIHLIPYDGAEEKALGASNDYARILEALLGGDESLLCLADETIFLKKCVKQMLDFLDEDSRATFEKRLENIFRFEDLAFLIQRDFQQTVSIDFIIEEVRSALEEKVNWRSCGCPFHKEVEEVHAECTLMKAHASLHLIFDRFSSPLGIKLTDRHYPVKPPGKIRSWNCSCSRDASRSLNTDEKKKYVRSTAIDASGDGPAKKLTPLMKHERYLDFLQKDRSEELCTSCQENCQAAKGYGPGSGKRGESLRPDKPKGRGTLLYDF